VTLTPSGSEPSASDSGTVAKNASIPAEAVTHHLPSGELSRIATRAQARCGLVRDIDTGGSVMPFDGMEPGFWHFGWREGAAVLLAVVIIADWAVTRYLQREPRQDEQDVKDA
jgi:hypothetical protein